MIVLLTISLKNNQISNLLCKDGTKQGLGDEDINGP